MADEMITTVDDLYDRYDLTEPERRHEEALSNEIYEATPQGVTLSLSGRGSGVLLTTIVEGTDAEWARALTFPFSADEWEGALQEAEDWAREIADSHEPGLGIESYTLSEADVAALRIAVDYYLAESTGDAPNDELEHIALMLSDVRLVMITYNGPEGN